MRLLRPAWTERSSCLADYVTGHPDSAFRAAAAAITAADTYEEAVDRCAEHSAEALLACCVISLPSEDGDTLNPIGLYAPDPAVVDANEPILGVPLPSDGGFA